MLGSGCDSQFPSSTGSFDLPGHAGQRLLHGLERAERTTELDALAGVLH